MTEQVQIDFTGRRSPGLTEEEMRVWNVLEGFRGKASAILGPVIAARTGIDYDTIRAIISRLVNNHAYLIASCSRGYFIPVTPEEIFLATKSLRHRGIAILMRAARIQKASLEAVFGQAKMEYDVATHESHTSLKNKFPASVHGTETPLEAELRPGARPACRGD
jgi:hypothetical protein